MWFRQRRGRHGATVLSSLMSQTREFIVCFDFVEPIAVDLRGDALNVKLRDAVVVEASAPFARFMGFSSREELIGKHMMDLLSGSVPPWFVDYGNDVENSGYRDLERIVVIPVGKDRVVHARIHMQNIIEDDHLVRQWVTVRDVTAEALQKRELEASERTKALALRAANLSTFSVQFDTRQIEVDQTSSTSIGPVPKTIEEAAEIVDAADRDRVIAQLGSLRLGDVDGIHTEFRVAEGSTEPRWVEMWARVSERDTANRALGLAGVYRDTTESRALESKLRSVQKLETLGMLSGGIAHDFNNLLTTIMGSADLARRDAGERADALDRIDAASQQAAELCSQLLAYAGRSAVSAEGLDLAQLVEGMLELMRVSLEKSCSLEVRGSGPVWVRGDASQLRQVVMNLVQNAAESSPKTKSVVEVDVGRATYEPSWRTRFHLGADLEPGDYGYVEVNDQGVGMTSEELEHLFDPFFTTKFAGRGLGLAVVLGVVRGHRGAIEIDTERGRGTRVRVVLPCGERPPSSDLVTARGRPTSLRGRALVVDDEPAVLRTVAKMLMGLGLEVETAHHGGEAIERVLDDRERYDVMLIDMTMPEVDGATTASRILERLPDARIVLTSGYNDQSVPAELERRVAFIQKPYRTETLSDVLDAALSGSPPTAPVS